jgi:hypothetical protein
VAGSTGFRDAIAALVEPSPASHWGASG